MWLHEYEFITPKLLCSTEPHADRTSRKLARLPRSFTWGGFKDSDNQPAPQVKNKKSENGPSKREARLPSILHKRSWSSLVNPAVLDAA